MVNYSRFYLLNRVLRRKFLLISIVLIFLILAVSFSSSRLSSFSALFSANSENFKNFDSHKFSQNNDLNLDIKVKRWKSDKLENEQKNEKSLFLREKLEKMKNSQFTDKSHQYIPHHRLIHLDLKGAPPKVSYFAELFPLLFKAGATGLLIEYEDSFPFEKDLENVVIENSYKKEDIQKINLLAKQNNLEVIPLVQTFGHLEFFLKLEKYRYLRENDDFPQAICPSRNGSFNLVTQIIDQVLDLHPDARWLHIGCDEVFQLGSCDLCRLKNRDDLFLEHVEKVSKYVKETYNVIPIIWDDLLRQFPPETFQKFGFKEIGVEIMIWTYVDDIYRFIPNQQWMIYAQFFPNIWGASAFKGAFGETLTVPNVKMHLDNNIAWLHAMEEQSKQFKNIRGLVLTGWQRYDHLATLCELLPAGMPSLIINLLTVSEGKYDVKVLDYFDELLKCEKNFYFVKEKIFIQDPNFYSKIYCQFPGVSVFKMIREFETVNKRVDDYLYDVTIHKAWLTEYNFRHNITSPFRIKEGLQEYYDVFYSLKSLLKMAVSALEEVYDDFTVYEWIEQKIYPQLIRMEKFYNQTMNIQKLKTWPKRPFKPNQDIFRFME